LQNKKILRLQEIANQVKAEKERDERLERYKQQAKIVQINYAK
jgi:hypothetical protein